MFDVSLIIATALFGVVAWLLTDPDRRQRAAAWLACGWVLPSAALLDYLSSQLEIWSPFLPVNFDRSAASGAFWGSPELFFPWPHAVIFGAPVIVLVWRVVIWGWVPALLCPRLDMRLVFPLGVLADEWFLHFARLSASGSVTSALFHLAVAAACMLPAQCFSRWTRERSHLSMRVWMHFLFHSTLLLGVVSMLLLSLVGGFGAPGLRSSVVNKLLLQLLVIPAVLLASAMREFYLAGGTPMPADAPLKLVKTGPYAYVANPMQIGKFGVLAGWAIFWSSPLIFGAAVFGLLYSLTVARDREDREMFARFGSEWTRYRIEVRQWWPRWRPYFEAANSSEVPKPSRLYLDGNCGPCAELAGWLARARPKGLQVLPIASYAVSHPGRMIYAPAEGGLDQLGVRALSRGLEHVNLFWAFFAWMASLPVSSWVAELIADAVTAEAAGQSCARPLVSTQTPSATKKVL
jgi:protein-S-isoprenylcysteine O-methyltransferase Ste14